MQSSDQQPPLPASCTWSPTYYFFYGTLMDPQVLKRIAGMSTEPTMQKGSIQGYKIKLWGTYPTLIPSDDASSVVLGRFCMIEEKKHVDKLARYETRAYETARVTIEGEDGTKYEGWAFRWAGAADDPILEDGVFDLEQFQKNLKPYLIL